MKLLEQNKPLFFVLEGMDYSGKSTLACYLAEHLCNEDKLTTAFGNPGGDTLGMKIREILSMDIPRENDVDLLLLAANRLHLAEKAKQELQANRHVVIDRWDISAHVYQRGEREGILKDRLYYGILPMHDKLYEYPKPDVIIWLDPTKEVVEHRAKNRPEKDNGVTKYEWDNTDPDGFDKWFKTLHEQYSSIMLYHALGNKWQEEYKRIQEEKPVYCLYECPTHPMLGSTPAKYILRIEVDMDSSIAGTIELIHQVLFKEEDILPYFVVEEEYKVDTERLNQYLQAGRAFLKENYNNNRGNDNETTTHSETTSQGGEAD